MGAAYRHHVMPRKASDETARPSSKPSRDVFRRALGKPVGHLAYPYGGPDLVGKREVRIAAELGYKTAVTTRPGVLFPRARRPI